MRRAERRYTPRRKKAQGSSDAITREAEMLATQALPRLRSFVSDKTLAKIEAIASPIDRLEAILDAADAVAPAASPDEVKWCLPGHWERKRLGDLRAGRTFQIRQIVIRDDGSEVNVPRYPEGDPK